MLPHIRYCFDCNIAEVAEVFLDAENRSKADDIMTKLNERNATIEYVRSPPQGFGPQDASIKAAVDILEDLAGAAVIRSVTSTIKKFIKEGARTIIDRHARDVYRLRTAQERDCSMCAALVYALELPSTSTTQGSFEEARWLKVSKEWAIRSFWRWTTRDHALTDYLIAWGIHYTLKFYAVKETITHGFANSYSNEAIVENCKKVLGDYSDQKQLVIFEFIMNSDVEQAYKHFFCD